jgi:hypothetical protein
MVVVVLLNEGVDINENTGAALMLAARQGHLNIVNMLLAKGAKVSLAVEGGYTPLCVATRNGHAAVTAALLRAGAEADEEAGPVGMTLYMNASVDAPNATSQGDLVSAPSSGNEGGDEMGNESSSDLNTKHETNSDSDANADGKQRSDADGDGVLGTAWSTGNGVEYWERVSTRHPADNTATALYPGDEVVEAMGFPFEYHQRNEARCARTGHQ